MSDFREFKKGDRVRALSDHCAPPGRVPKGSEGTVLTASYSTNACLSVSYERCGNCDYGNFSNCKPQLMALGILWDNGCRTGLKFHWTLKEVEKVRPAA